MSILKRLFHLFFTTKGHKRRAVYIPPNGEVVIETGELGIQVYHDPEKVNWGYAGYLGFKRVTRREAEALGYRPCEECFGKIEEEV